ncbi:hypothetical protein HBA55_29805 [Pseudomaricurvus alkylphenolicus]|uniref:hypothetical protein n=1 Tax=Pseudomaricurvus alkylphenolicus TaxID=1306991 RepID=UPI00141DD976|nr:hypothetical protein [Pseudomaricurvus alkylphenolicus]NIB43835.1 hypothetical protein [Pseudomaricurvus alkylphenolicus]
MKDRYFQTWTWNSRLRRRCKWCAALWQRICGLFGHEPSKTEWGYSGGDTGDAWCRWCNKHMEIPKSELLFRLGKEGRGILNTVEPTTEEEGS